MELQEDASSLLISAYKQGKWSDITIVNGGKEYQVHKHILSTSIPYFDKMFSSGLSESTSKVIKLDHPAIPFDLIIEWAYCSKILITKENVIDLFHLADYMNIPKLTTECLNLLWNDFSDSPLIDLDLWIDQIATEETRKFIDRFIRSSFCDIVYTNSFLGYAVDIVVYMISLVDLKIASEIQVFEAIIRWIEADKEYRLTHLPKLLKKVHWIDICRVDLMTKLDEFSWIRNYQEARSVIMAALEMSLYGSLEQVKVDDLNLNHRKSSSLDFYLLNNQSYANVLIRNTVDQNATFLSADSDLSAGKFNNLYVTDHKIENDNGVIRIDWKNNTFRLFNDVVSYYDLMFDRLFHFDFTNKEVYLWKGDRSIARAPVPDYVRSSPDVTKYAASFYITSVDFLRQFKNRLKHDSFAYNLRIAKFDPLENIWQDVTHFEIVTKQALRMLKSKALIGSIEICVNHSMVLIYHVASNTFEEKKNSEELDFGKGFYRFRLI